MVKNTWEERSGSISDPTVYSGLLGTALTCLRSYEATGDQHDLVLCSEIVDACAMLAPLSVRYIIARLGKIPLVSGMKNIILYFLKK